MNKTDADKKNTATVKVVANEAITFTKQPDGSLVEKRYGNSRPQVKKIDLKK